MTNNTDSTLAPKPGWQTSEFYIVLAPVVVMILKLFGVDVNLDATAQFITVVAGVVGTVYVAARTYLKTVRLKTHAQVVTASQPVQSPAYWYGTGNPIVTSTTSSSTGTTGTGSGGNAPTS